MDRPSKLLTVAEIAPPGSQGKVTADYSGKLLFFGVSGTLGTQVVTADQRNGNRSAKFAHEVRDRAAGEETCEAPWFWVVFGGRVYPKTMRT